MKYIITLLFIVIAGCGSGGSGPSMIDQGVELENYKVMVAGFQYVSEFRNHIHWLNHLGITKMDPPYKAEYYTRMLSGDLSTLCGGMSMHLGAFCESEGIEFRHVELWAGSVNSSGYDNTHSVLEVKENGRWVMHDTTYNLVILVDGEPASVAEIKSALAKGITPEFYHQGYEYRDDLDVNVIEDIYWGYFAHPVYTYETVFFYFIE